MTQTPAAFPQPPAENVGLAGAITWLFEVLAWFVARAAARSRGEGEGWVVPDFSFPRLREEMPAIRPDQGELDGVAEAGSERAERSSVPGRSGSLRRKNAEPVARATDAAIGPGLATATILLWAGFSGPGRTISGIAGTVRPDDHDVTVAVRPRSECRGAGSSRPWATAGPRIFSRGVAKQLSCDHFVTIT
jgi:hypothetical protein